MAVRTRAKRKRQRHIDVGQASDGAKVGAPSKWLTLSTRYGGPLLILLVGAAMLCWSWRTWPDVLVDFGRELYVAWRLAVGETLYKDIAYFNGPLSPYVNALWFRLLGTNLLTLAVCNVVLLTGFVTLLYRLIAEVADRLAATAACLTLVTIFTFGQFAGIGNYNFVCPYSHEATHGVMLAFLLLFCLRLHHRGGKTRYLAGAGLVLGLVFLTKVEVFSSAAVAALGYLALILSSQAPPRRRVARTVVIFLGCAGIPPLLAFALLCAHVPAGQALAGTLGSWHALFNQGLTSLRFYRVGMGLDDPASHFKTMLAWIGWYLVIFGPAAGLGLVLRKPGRFRLGVAGVWLLIVGGVIATRWQTIEWFDAVRPLPLIMLALAAVFFVRFRTRRRRLQDVTRPALALSMILLALVLLGKMILRARVYHYGFVLAMPATLLLVVTLVSWLPGWIAKLGGYGGIVRGTALVVLVFAIAWHLRFVEQRFNQKIHLVGRGADTIRADPRGLAVQAALEAIDHYVAPQQTLLVMPEGVMLNYLTKRVNPVPYLNFMPPELIIFGEEVMLTRLRESPPDFIAIVHKDTSEYGFRYFGRDYGQQIMSWVKQDYLPIWLWGAQPLQDGRPGVLLMQRKDIHSGS